MLYKKYLINKFIVQKEVHEYFFIWYLKKLDIKVRYFPIAYFLLDTEMIGLHAAGCVILNWM